MKLSSLLFEQWHLFPALTLCKLCYHIYHTERMTTATASNVGRRPPPQEPKCTGGAGGGGEEGCPLLSHLNSGLSQKAAKPKQHMGCGGGLCCLSVFLFPRSAGCLWVQQDMTRVLPPERGEESWPEVPLSPEVPLQLRVASQRGCSLLFTLTLEINSCISETWVYGDRCCA